IGAEAVALFQFFRQNGRILLRIEAIEARLASTNFGTAPAAPAPVPAHGLPIGSPAPDFELTSLEGRALSLKGMLSEGNPLLLLFTDPNCGPCNALMPDVAGWQNSLAGEIKLVLISTGRQDLNR